MPPQLLGDLCKQVALEPEGGSHDAQKLIVIARIVVRSGNPNEAGGDIDIVVDCPAVEGFQMKANVWVFAAT